MTLVLGATGYVGSALVEELAQHPHVERVVAHVRPGSPRLESLAARLARTAPRAEIAQVPFSVESLEELYGSHAPTHVFLCHGTTSRRAKAEGIDRPYEAVDVGLTRVACEAAEPLELKPRMVHLSSMGTGPRARGAYLQARWRAEELVRGSGCPYTICRAPLLTGPDRVENRTGELLAARILDPALGLLGALGARRLSGRYRSMDAAEAAEGLARTGLHYMTINRIVLGDELRRQRAYQTETPAPDSRREAGRH